MVELGEVLQVEIMEGKGIMPWSWHKNLWRLYKDHKTESKLALTFKPSRIQLKPALPSHLHRSTSLHQSCLHRPPAILVPISLNCWISNF